MLLSSPVRAVIEPCSCIYRALFVLLSSRVRAVIEPYSCCYRAVFVLLSSSVPAVIELFRAVSIRALAVKFVAR